MKNKRLKFAVLDKGITLISLIVTILVLLILAGITLATLTDGDGILTNTQSATKEYKKAEYQDAIDSAVAKTHLEEGKEQWTADAILDRVEELLKENEMFNDSIEPWERYTDENGVLTLVVPTNEGNFEVKSDGAKYWGTDEEINTLPELEQEDIQFTYDKSWKNTDKNGPVEVTISKEKSTKEEYKESTIYYSTDKIHWTAYTGPVQIKDNKTTIYVELRKGTELTNNYVEETITNIDRLNPKTFTIKTQQIETDSITVGATVEDAEETDKDGKSGIEEHWFSKDGGTNWETNTNKKQENYTFKGLEQETQYPIKMKVIDKAGNETIAETKITTKKVPGLNDKDSESEEGIQKANVTFTDTPNTWTNGNVQVKIETKETKYKLQYNTGNVKEENEWKYYSESVTMENNGTIYARLIDDSNNIGEYAVHEITNIEREKPTITINPNSGAAVKTRQITITVGDEGGSKLSETNIYQYYVSKSNTELTGGEWKNYTSGQAFTIGENITGTRYIWVKQIADNAGNKSEATKETYKISGAYVIDNTGPTITFGTDGSTTYKKSQSTTITVTEAGGSTVNTSSLKYIWNQSSTAPAESAITTEFTSGATATKSGVTGNNWYLWAIAKDALGNTTIKGTKAFYLDNTVPTVKVSSNTTVGKSQTATITIGDEDSGLAAGTHTIKYQWTTSTSAPTWSNVTTTKTITVASGAKTGTVQVSKSDGTNTYYLHVQAQNLKDVAENTVSPTAYGTFKIDNAGPTITFGTDGSTTYKKSQSTTIKVAEVGGSTVNASSLKYVWTQSSIAPVENAITTTFASGETATKSGVTGNNWYLWAIAKDALGNTTIKGTKAFYLDNTAPTIKLSTNTSTTYEKTKSVTVTIEDSLSGIPSGISIKYGWSTTTTTAPTTYITATLNTYSAGAKSTTFTATGSALTGAYYLWVTPVTLKDVAENSNTTSVKSGVFNFDNAAPTITTATNPTRVKGNTNSVSISVSGISDTGGSGLKGYYVAYNNSTAPTASSTWQSLTSSSFTYNVSSPGTYYIWVIDNAGNISAYKSCTFTESTAVAERVNGSASNATKYFSTLQAAVTSATTDTINLKTSTTENVSVNSGKNITLALGGYTITGTITNNGTLTINGSGTIQGPSSSGNTIVNNNVLTTSNCTIKGTNSSNATISNKSGTANISGGTITATNHNAINIAGGEVKVTSGTVSSSSSPAIYLPGGKLTVGSTSSTSSTSPVISSSSSHGIEIGNGEVTVYSGTVNSTTLIAIYITGGKLTVGTTSSTSSTSPLITSTLNNAIKITGGEVTVYSGKVISSGCSAIWAKGGTLTVGSTSKTTCPAITCSASGYRAISIEGGKVLVNSGTLSSSGGDRNICIKWNFNGRVNFKYK